MLTQVPAVRCESGSRPRAHCLLAMQTVLVRLMSPTGGHLHTRATIVCTGCPRKRCSSFRSIPSGTSTPVMVYNMYPQAQVSGLPPLKTSQLFPGETDLARSEPGSPATWPSSFVCLGPFHACSLWGTLNVSRPAFHRRYAKRGSNSSSSACTTGVPNIANVACLRLPQVASSHMGPLHLPNSKSCSGLGPVHFVRLCGLRRSVSGQRGLVTRFPAFRDGLASCVRFF